MPAGNPRDIMPLHAILSMTLAGLAFTCPNIAAEIPIQAKAVLGGMIILLLISSEVQRNRVNAEIREADAKNCKSIQAPPLPRKFTLKLVTTAQTTPSEFADALTVTEQRSSWELKLKQSKVKDSSQSITISAEYIGISAPHEIAYDLEILPAKMQDKQSVASFLVHELTTMNQGLVKATTIYLLEEIANRPGSLRVTQFCQVSSEDEARSKLKRLISLRTMLGQ